MDYERTLSRSFTGLRDDEWEHLGKITNYVLGPGKRSMFLCTLVRKTIENVGHEWESVSTIEQRASSAINDSFRFFGKKEFVRKLDNTEIVV